MEGVETRERAHNVLFLQGPCTLFFSELGKELARRGHKIHRLNFNGGDKLFWRLQSEDFLGDLSSWLDFIRSYLDRNSITDVFLFGDWRPLHRAAVAAAKERGIRVHVFEEGYLRPNWITMECGGVNGRSSLSREPSWYLSHLEAAPRVQEVAEQGSAFLSRALADVTYQLASVLLAWKFVRYQTHLPLNPFREYLAWIIKFLRTPKQRRETDKALAYLKTEKKRYFLFPLQLDTDSQIRIDSSFRRQAPAIKEILSSFSRYADAADFLVIKEHPLDPQIEAWATICAGLALQLGIAERVIYIRGGDLGALAQNCVGMVTINSTSGIEGLRQNVPVLALADPIYRITGLTAENGLDSFWRNPIAPSTKLVEAFRRVVAHNTQIPGNFYTCAGIALAIEGVLKRMKFPFSVDYSLSKPAETLSRDVKIDIEHL